MPKNHKHEKDNRFYYTFNYPSAVPESKTLLTGIRQVKNSEKTYITGFYEYPNGDVITFVFKGYLNGKGKWYTFTYPSSSGVTVIATNLYGPNNGHCENIQIVGNYTTIETGMSTIGCLYEGPIDGTGEWTTLIPTSIDPVLNTIAHSTNGGLVVGNYDTQLDEGKAFIYDIKSKKYYDIFNPHVKSITAYGIWHNYHHSYTICGGYSNLKGIPNIDSAYLVDWNNKTHKFSNWRSYSYDNDPIRAVITHFDGITTDNKGGYYLTGDWIGFGEINKLGFIAHVKKNGKTKWAPVSYPKSLISSGNSILENVVIGVYTSKKDSTINGFISI